MALIPDIQLEQIGKEVLNSIEVFDEQIQSLKSVISFGLDDASKHTLFNQASDISIAIGGVCLAVAVILAYVSIVREGLSLRGDWKKVVTIMLRLAITKGLIDTSTQFVAWIYSFPAKITSIVISNTSNLGGEDGKLATMLKVEDIANGLGVSSDSSKIERLMALMYAKMLGFFFFVIALVIMIIVIGRMLKIYTLLAFSSVAFAKIPLNGLSSCKDYIKEMCALGLQGGIIATSVSLFEVAVTDASSIVNINSSWGTFGVIVVLAVSMILLITKSEEIARKVI